MDMVIELGLNNSVFNQFLSELRDSDVQKDSQRFRRNLERVGEIFVYEISKVLEYQEKDIVTPLGISKMNVLKEKPLMATILRAGMPMHQGLLNYFDNADNAFVSAYRKYKKNEDFIIKMDYISTPSVADRNLIITDPMLATGGSMNATIKALLQNGVPKSLHIVCLLACEEGISLIKRNFSLYKPTIWIGAIDAELTAKGYIVPGLGDAGDLAYGTKLD